VSTFLFPTRIIQERDYHRNEQLKTNPSAVEGGKKENPGHSEDHLLTLPSGLAPKAAAPHLAIRLRGWGDQCR